MTELNETKIDGFLESQFKDKEFVLQQLREARSLFTNKDTTENQWDAMDRILGFCLLYASEEMMPLVQSVSEEADRRKIYFMINVWKLV
jgi:hypothetical protein